VESTAFEMLRYGRHNVNGAILEMGRNPFSKAFRVSIYLQYRIRVEIV
jgi:hypothetical protein